ncbi:MvaI/BcnI family restriction endonuclease, partial [Alphaproteobacteria bacterium]|nr:MvaI/BcnI family restriction endonuclease [Alphaproteobacteria bacterium]
MSIYDHHIKKFSLIKKQYYIKSRRLGDTGVGYTFQKLLNQSDTDKKKYHIKCFRSNSNRIVTLFAKTPNWGSGGREKLLNDYGYFDKNNRWSLYTSIYLTKKNKRGWSI